jgi:DNA-binding response OmpR family regulator
MSGIESTREIRKLEKESQNIFKRSFIVALTGLAATSDQKEAFDAGVDAFMVKPVNFKELERLITEHLKKRDMTGE